MSEIEEAALRQAAAWEGMARRAELARDKAVARAEAAEARIAAAIALCDGVTRSDAWIHAFTEMLRAALAEPVEPQPSACAYPGCNGKGRVTEDVGLDLPVNRPCPSCTPPDPESETR